MKRELDNGAGREAFVGDTPTELLPDGVGDVSAPRPDAPAEQLPETPDPASDPDDPTGELFPIEEPGVEPIAFLSSAEELGRFDFGASGAALAVSFAGGPAPRPENPAVPDETRIMPECSMAFEAAAQAPAPGEDTPTTLLSAQAVGTRRHPTSQQPANGAAPVAAAARTRLPLPLLVVLATCAVLLVACVLFFGPPRVGSDTAYHYSVSFVDQDGAPIMQAEEHQGKQGEHITINAPVVEGYRLQSASAPSTADVEKDGSSVGLVLSSQKHSAVTFSYAKVVSYSVRYLDKATKKAIAPKKTYDDCLAGSKVSALARGVKDYEPVGAKVKKLVLGNDSNDNVISFYYKKKSVPSKTGNTGSSSSGGSSSGGGGGGPSFADGAIEV